MEWHVLIATPHRVQREELYTLYSTCPLVASIEYVTNSKDLSAKLEQTHQYYVVVHRSFVTDTFLLPKGRFVILAEKMNKDMLIAASNHGGHYFLDNPLPVAMLLAVLDPVGAYRKPEFPTKTTLPPVKEVLTPCQLQVFELWKKGLTYKEIAAELQLSFHTVKNHLEDARKRLREHNLPVK